MATKIDPKLALDYIRVAEMLIRSGFELGRKLKEMAQKDRVITPEEWKSLREQNRISMDDVLTDRGGTPPNASPSTPTPEPEPEPSTPTPTPEEPSTPPAEPPSEPIPETPVDPNMGKYGVILTSEPLPYYYQKGDHVYKSTDGRWRVDEARYGVAGGAGWDFQYDIVK